MNHTKRKFVGNAKLDFQLKERIKKKILILMNILSLYTIRKQYTVTDGFIQSYRTTKDYFNFYKPN